MRYHIVKATRVYEGFPYSGPANNNQPAEAETLEEAKELAELLTTKNPVGFCVFDTETGEFIKAD